MNPWLRFWLPHHDTADEGSTPPHDAALWSPKALADTQRELWRHAAQATHDWWTYWRALWPAVPVQPQAGVVTPPPEPREAASEAVPEEHGQPTPVERRRRPRAAHPHGGTTPSQRPRHAARGK